MIEAAAVKKALRKDALARRDAIPPLDRAPAAAAVAARLVKLVAALPGVPRTGVVAGYLAMRSELDPLPAMLALAARGHGLCLPAVVERGGVLVFRPWHPDSLLDDGPLGTRQPAPGAGVARPDLLIVPLLAFDRSLNRLGYGGGYYDRSLAALRAVRRTTAIGVAFAAQEAAEPLPLEAWDQPLDAIVTERDVLTARDILTAG